MEEPVHHAPLKPGMTVDELLAGFSGCAFGAGRLARAAEIYSDMVADRGCTRFLGLAGAMVPAGMREVIGTMLDEGHVDVLVTTGANVVHDIIEAVGGSHMLGSPDADDDSLRERGINRIYDVFLADEHFATFEEWMVDALQGLGKESVTPPELFDYLGSRIDDAGSILYRARKRGVPVFCPAFGDSMVGLQTWLHSQTNRMVVDSVGELQKFMDVCYAAKRAGVLILGGGVPKNYILQSMLLTERGFDYAIQLTMDRPETGGLSGATLDEAKSWGKLRADTRHVTVYSDATIALPLIVAHSLGGKRG